MEKYNKSNAFCTSKEQSERLRGILTLDSADMSFYDESFLGEPCYSCTPYTKNFRKDVGVHPAWSLQRLMSIIRTHASYFSTYMAQDKTFQVNVNEKEFNNVDIDNLIDCMVDAVLFLIEPEAKCEPTEDYETLYKRALSRAVDMAKYGEMKAEDVEYLFDFQPIEKIENE